MPKKAIFEKKNILITGGAGFIGSHLCDELVKDSKVICIDNFVSGDESNIDHLLQNPDFQFIKHDINQPINLEELPELEKFQVKFQGVQEIYHLAVPTSPKDFERLKVDTVLTNSVGTKNVLDLAVKYNAKFLLTSSAVVYGPRNTQDPYFREDYIGEVDQLSPRACYDEGKRFAETLTRTYGEAHNLDTKIVRIFRTYGPRMKLKTGEMLPDFVSNALEGQDLVIFGDENFSSSFCHVSDVVQGLTKIMKSGEAGPINLGSDLEYKIVDVAKKVIELTNSKSKIVFEKPLLFMSPLGLPDITAAKERFGWFPVVLLEAGIKGAIDYFRAHKAILGPTSRLKR
ncbi:MAG: NAD-dependent epimerase/dehydratase family protein [Candidatus Buchananbacteria bacterium]|nr:NAD-dependent epimerase/dehydratase family protein [Candidatus Buchananbacteria bacterium]